jgi:hypothetical protein
MHPFCRFLFAAYAGTPCSLRMSVPHSRLCSIQFEKGMLHDQQLQLCIVTVGWSMKLFA